MTVTSLRFKIYGMLLLVNTIVLALSAHINHFQEYFYKADIFPFVLSVATMVVMLAMIFADIAFKNSVTAWPLFELGWLLALGLLWLGFNAFSTNRWRYASLSICSTIPSDAQYAPYRTWCHELQALRVFVWVEWVMFLFTFAYLLRWTINKYNCGRHDVWTTSFSRFSEESSPSEPHSRHRIKTNSEFLQWEKFPQESSSPVSPSVAGVPPVLYTQTVQPIKSPFDRYLEAQHEQHGKGQYVQHAEEAAPYVQYPQGQYILPSQASFTHSAHAL